MKLETKRLILRKYKLSDWQDVVEGVSEYDVTKMLSAVPRPYKKKDALDFLKRSIKKYKQKPLDGLNLAIELKKEKKVIGSIGIHKISHRNNSATTGSWVNKKYWCNGYMTEAKIAFNDFAFNTLKLGRLESEVYTDNPASNAVQQKVGYTLEGTKRQAAHNIADRKIHDLNIYGLLKPEWKKRRASLVKEMKRYY